MLSFIIVIGVVFLWIRICAGFFLSFVYICIAVGDPVINRRELRSSYQEERVGIPFTGLTPPHFYTCPKPGLEFPTSYVVVFLCSVSSDER